MKQQSCDREKIYCRVISFLMGALFIYASIHKIVDPESFAVAVSALLKKVVSPVQ